MTVISAGVSSPSSFSARVAGSRALRFSLQLGLLVVLLCAYSLASALSAEGRFLPSVADISNAFFGLLASTQFWGAVGYTAGAGGLGLLISLVVGAVVGALLSVHWAAFASAQFVIDFMRTIPPLALIPVGLLLLGSTLRMEVTLIVISAVWPVLLQVYYAVLNVDPKLIEIGRSFRVSRARRVLYITAPAIGPAFATSVRLSATLCLLLAIGTELLASGNGLGYLVGFFQTANRIPDAYATIIVIGLLGLGVNVGLGALEKRLFRWHRREAKA